MHDLFSHISPTFDYHLVVKKVDFFMHWFLIIPNSSECLYLKYGQVSFGVSSMVGKICLQIIDRKLTQFKETIWWQEIIFNFRKIRIIPKTPEVKTIIQYIPFVVLEIRKNIDLRKIYFANREKILVTPKIFLIFFFIHKLH